MGKKRKAAPRTDEPSATPAIHVQDSRKRIKTYEDVADSDDEFHLNQDEIRLREDAGEKRRRKWAKQEEFLQPSDEEVLGHSDEEEDSEGSEDGAEEESEEESEEDGDEGLGWGTSKEALYGADAIETEEQALEEEAEALRLQKKQLQSMNAADYGFDEDEWQDGDDVECSRAEKEDAVVTEVLPQLQIDPELGPAERLKLLNSRYPEFELLSKDLLRLKDTHATLSKEATTSSIAHTKLRAASAYLGALVMYFSLLTSTASHGAEIAAAMPPTQLRDHPVMDDLVQTRELWTKVQPLSDDVVSAMAANESAVNSIGGYSNTPFETGTASEELGKKTRAERHAEAVKAAADKRKAERMQRTEAELLGLDALIAPSAKQRTSRSSRPSVIDADASDLGEEAPMTAREAADKAKKRKSLRFYTSQIAQKANKRGAAGRSAGGDDDIPYRERLRDRQARLNAEAEKRGRRDVDAGAELGGDSDDDDRQQAQKIREAANEDDYYDIVATRAAKKKSDKAALSEVQKQAALTGGRVVEEETVGADGKRKISYAIEKNKGLTPHRKKDVRNPRVKKRKKFDEKKKKLASIKPVYKGGEGRGGYGGELTGIKKGLVKSTKL